MSRSELKTDPAKVREWQERSRRTSTLKPSKGLKPRSKKGMVEDTLYRIARTEYLAGQPKCCRPDCNQIATEVHHAAGRIGERGERRWNKLLFRGMCCKHHRLAHDQPELAKALGISVSRLGRMEE